MKNKYSQEGADSLSPGQIKINEYVSRILAGESQDSIVRGLSPSFRRGIEQGLLEHRKREGHAETDGLADDLDLIPAQYRGLPSDILEELWINPTYVDDQKNAELNERRRRALKALRREEKDKDQNRERQLDTEAERALQLAEDAKHVQDLRKQANLSNGSFEVSKAVGSDDINHALDRFRSLLNRRILRKPILQAAYDQLLDNLAKEGDKGIIAGKLMAEIYHEKRQADYQRNPKYSEAWKYGTSNTELPMRMENGWVYRGLIPTKENGKTTETRGSLNVTVTPEVIRELDDLIRRGVVNANYKFGDPDTPASAEDRHDAITIYFLDSPSMDAIDAIGKIAKKHYRGENLLGRKISEGFFLSEIGSVRDVHAAQLIEQLKKIDQGIAKAIGEQLTNKKRIAMSEAQYYAAKETLGYFGIDLSYDGITGFTVQRR